MSETPMSSERLEEIRTSYSGFPEDAIPLLEEKADLIGEVDRLHGIVSEQAHAMKAKLEEVDRLRELNSRLTRSLGTLEQAIADAPDTDWRKHLQSAIERARSFGPPETPSIEFPAANPRFHQMAERQRKLARQERSELAAERVSLARADLVQLEAELNCGRQPVLWLFRAGSGPVYASRQKPEPQVLAGVLTWIVDGQLCPVSLPLRDWIEPGQRLALVALPIGGDA